MSEEVSVLKSIPKQFAALMETEVRPPISEMAAVLNGTKQERRSTAGCFVVSNALLTARASRRLPR